MPKVVCEDCDEVIAEGVDEDEAQEIADAHTHEDAPHLVDRRQSEYDLSGDAPEGAASGGVERTNAEYDPDTATDGREADQQSGGDGAVDDEARDLDEQMDQMDQMDEDRDLGDWWDVSEDTDYTEVSDEYRRRYENVQEEVQKDRSLAGKMRSAREEKEGDNTTYARTDGRNYERLSETQQWQDLRDDVADAFRKLKSRNVPKPSRKGAQLNMDAILQREAGDKSRTRLFKRQEQAAKGDRVVGVSVDFSGSMYEAKAKMAVAAVATAAEIIGDDVVANCWTNDRKHRFGHGHGKFTAGLLVGPDERFDWSNLSAFSAGGGTPTADGIANLQQLMEDITAREKVMIVVTDGKPNSWKGGGDADKSPTRDSVQDAAHVVRQARQDGYKVVGLGVGAVNESTMATVFGPNGYVSADDENLDTKLVEVYKRQLRVSE